MGVFRYRGITPVVHPTAFIHPDATLIGDVIVGQGCFIGPAASLRGDLGRLIVMQGSNVQDGCVIHGSWNAETVVEENGHISHGAVLHGCVIRRDAMVGIKAVVMDNCEIGAGAIVAAMSFVKPGFKVPANTLAVGIPAKIVRELSEEDVRWKREGTNVYHQLALHYRTEQEAATALAVPEADRPHLPLPHGLPPEWKPGKR